jgi:hypothetical protein
MYILTMHAAETFPMTSSDLFPDELHVTLVVMKAFSGLSCWGYSDCVCSSQLRSDDF